MLDRSEAETTSTNVSEMFQGQQIFVIDGFGLLFRSFYALVSTTMTSANMFDTRAVYGFANVLLSLLHKHVKGDPAVVVFEGERKQGQLDHRRAAYPEYKSNRVKTPAGIIEAIPWVKRLLRALGLSILEQPVFEADDIIGTFVQRAKRCGIRTVIVSVDKDFLQLLDSDLVTILKPGTNSKPFEYVTESSFRAEFADLHPSQYVDILTLIGDSTDSIKGVPGIGPQTAPKLIKRFGSLEQLLAAARAVESVDKSPPKKNDSGWWKPEFLIPFEDFQEYKQMRKILTASRAESLRYYEQRTLLMKSMVAIRDNVNLPEFAWEKFFRHEVIEDEIESICSRLEFSSTRLRSRLIRSADDVSEKLLKKYKQEGNPTLLNSDVESLISMTPTKVGASKVELTNDSSGIGTNPVVLSDDEEIASVCANASGCIGCSCVLSSDDNGIPIVQGIAFSINSDSTFFIDFGNRTELPQPLATVLQDGSIEKAGWHMKETIKAIYATFNVFTRGRLFDVRIAADLLHGGHFTSDEALTDKYLWKGVLKCSLPNEDLKRLPTPGSAEGASILSEIGLRVALQLKNELRQKGLDRIAEHVEFPLIPVLAEMELCGVPLHANDLQTFADEVKNQLEYIENDLRKIAPRLEDGKVFRPSSTADVAKILYESWNLPLKSKRTPKGNYPTNKTTMSMIANDEKLNAQHREFAKLMIKYRETRTILSTYTTGLLRSIGSDGRVRATFLQDAAPSGRLSTSRPNLQSIPVRSSLGREVRRTVVARSGFGILCADYSQIELRILAALSGDSELKAAFARGDDVHTVVAARFFGLDVSEVTTEQRSAAKQTVYGLLYGMTARGLAQQLYISTGEARKLISSFRDQFPAVHNFTQSLVLKARERGYAETMAGRRLVLPILLNGTPQERRSAERVAINMPVQGTQADMIKIAMARVANRLREAEAESKLILQLHDELLLEVADDERAEVEELVREEMANALPLAGVEVVVNIGHGKSWLESTLSKSVSG